MVLFYDYKFSKIGIQQKEGILFAWDLKGFLKAHENMLLIMNGKVMIIRSVRT